MGNVLRSIHFPLAIDSGMGRLMEERDHFEQVEQLIKQVLFTNLGERVNRPDFGCGLRRMVFAPNSEITAGLARITILQALEKWLGSLIIVNNVNVKAEGEKLHIHIVYSVRTSRERRYLNLEVAV